MNEQEAQKLIDRYNQGIASPEERILLERWYLKEAAERNLLVEDDFERLDKEMWVGTLKKAGLPHKNNKSFKLWLRLAGAAAILLLAGVGIYFYSINHPVQQVAKTKAIVQDVAAGGNRAILTLSNGEQIVLADAAKGKIAEQTGISIRKTADGQLIYTAEKNGLQDKSKELVYNKIETPKGGQYQVSLPDGTIVWLNSASSLKFPAKFPAKERRVELTGEGYFEVAHNPAKPFRVISNKQEVEVLGTHFNMNTYADEDGDKTTLLEGSVLLKQFGKRALLKPGEQALLKGKTIEIAPADVEMAVAWKNGYFMFKQASLKTLMRQLAKWYDVEVSYSGNIPALLFSGKIHRNTSLAQTLELLSFSKVNFRIEGRKIAIIYP